MPSESGTLYVVGLLIAFVSAANGATRDPNKILRLCRSQRADYKIPCEIRVMGALPRTATGKIAKLELKKNL
jgi:long-chain acyl-CoA synthetase